MMTRKKFLECHELYKIPALKKMAAISFPCNREAM
jgi:hypothetical protein